mmetsp:Transcript_39426/g.98685  ORF Transcript_39426/g.98685 Transcript_39426/m.98685 type:complete len:325 (+) Transcript_39426:516-1490(+)
MCLEFDAEEVAAGQLAVQRVDLGGRRLLPMLKHHRTQLIDLVDDVGARKVEHPLSGERLTDGHDGPHMGVEHYARLTAVEEAEFLGVVHHSVVVVPGGRMHHVDVVVHKLGMVSTTGPEVDEAQSVVLYSVEKIGGIGVRLHDLVDEELVQAEVQQPLGNRVARRLVHRGHHLVQRDPGDKFGGEDMSRRELVDHLWHVQPPTARKQLPEDGVEPRLVLVVALGQQLGLHLASQDVQVHALGHQIGVGHQAEEVFEVALDGPIDARVLHLHCNPRPIVEPSLVNLSDGCGSNGDLVEPRKLGAPVATQLLLHHPMQLLLGHNVG